MFIYTLFQGLNSNKIFSSLYNEEYMRIIEIVYIIKYKVKN